jgi:NADH:ubiquinone oxidoreductase subunit 4 (subunit M)
MEVTPDTINYMIGGHILFAVVMIVYVASLALRWNNLKREEVALKELEK